MVYLSEKVAYKLYIWGIITSAGKKSRKSVPGSEKSKYKSPQVPNSLKHSRKQQKVSVAGL